MQYVELLKELEPFREKDFAEFQHKLICTRQRILGVRTSKLRALAKKYKDFFDDVFFFPDEYYEVTFIKATILSELPFERYVLYAESQIKKFDNWAVCDSFKPKSIRKKLREYLPYLERFFQTEEEFFQRHVLVMLLCYYIEEKYYPIIEQFLRCANTNLYYVYMASAWLVAEILIKDYDEGKRLLNLRFLSSKVHNKSIQKAIESYRLTKEQKEELKTLKIK